MTSRIALLSAGLATALAGTLAALPRRRSDRRRPPPSRRSPDQRLPDAASPTRARTAPVKICYTLFKPAGATAKHQVPMLMHSHGWGGSRTKDPAAFQQFLDAGYGVLSFDQRGFGESGGHALRREPRRRGPRRPRAGRPRQQARLGQQGRAGRPAAGRDRRQLRRRLPVPRRLRGAAASRASRSSTRSRPRSPGTTSTQSLAPRGRRPHRVGAGAQRRRRCRPTPCRRASTRRSSRAPRPAPGPTARSPAPRTSTRSSSKNGPAWHVPQGRRLDIPVLFGQGTTDTLFHLQQGLQQLAHRAHARARKHSIFVGYNGGHVLPAVFPQGVDVASDPCSKKLAGGDFRGAVAPVLRREAQGQEDRAQRLRPAATSRPRAARCTTVRRRPAGHGGRPRHGRRHDRPPAPPLATEVADGPDPDRRVVVPHRRRDPSALDNRAFYGLAVGTSPARRARWCRTT